MKSFGKQLLRSVPSKKEGMADNEKTIRNAKLILAVKNNETHEVHKLLKEEAFYEVHESADYKQTLCTALESAVKNGDLEITRMLLEHGADPTTKCREKGPAIIEKCKTLAMLKLVIREAYYYKNSHHTKKSILEMASDLGNNSVLALAKLALIHANNIKSNDVIHAIDLPQLIEKSMDIISESKLQKKHRKLSALLGLYFSKQSDNQENNALAIVFLTIAGNNKKYVNTENLKRKCYKKLNLAQLLNDKPLSRNELKALNEALESSQLIHHLKKYARNANINNELGKIYFLIQNYKFSCRHSIKAEKLDFIGNDCIIRLSLLIKHLPKKVGQLAKYRALCHHLGCHGKDQNDMRALEWLEKSINLDADDTFSFLTHPKKGLSLACKLLTTHKLFSRLNVDFAIKLYADKTIQSQLCDEEKAQFLLYCARHYPCHEWVRKKTSIKSIAENINSTLGQKLKCHFLMIAILNNDELTDENKTFGSCLRSLNKQDLETLLTTFSPFFKPAIIQWTKHVVKLYQYLVNHEQESILKLPYLLDTPGWHCLFVLTEGDMTLKHKHKIQRLIQSAALDEMNKSLDSHEGSKKDELIHTAMKDILFTSHTTSTYSPSRLFPVKSARSLKKQLTDENKNKITHANS